MTSEIIWMTIPIAALLSQIGGTWFKLARRLGIPLLLVGSWCYFVGMDFLIFLFGIALFGAYCLPFTLIGDDVGNNPINWLWLPVKGMLLCSPCLILDPSYWPGVIIGGLIFGAISACSNLKKTLKFFQWKFVEMFHGAIPATIYCLIATLSK